MQNRPQFASRNAAAQFNHGGLEAPLMPNPHHDTRSATSADRGLRFGKGAAQRFFTKDMFAGAGGGRNLGSMKLVRGGQHNRFNG